MGKFAPHAKEYMTEDKDQKIRKLIMTLSSDNDSIRKEARQTLVTIGSLAVPALIDALKQKDDHVKREAVKALCEIEDPELAPMSTTLMA
jgi:HEAT repeat protein